MKAFGKILGLVLLGLLLLVIGLGFALTHFFDPNDYKNEIRQLARDKANLELNIHGDIGWSLFPWLGLELHRTSVASASSPEQPFADLRMLGLSVRVLPLLRREVQMSDIRIDGLSLMLRRNEQGQSNWENIGQPVNAEAPEQSPPRTDSTPAEEAPARTGMPIKLEIDSLTINDARITYQDAQTGQQFSAESIQLEAGAIREGSAIPVKLTAFFGSNQPLIRARTEILGELRFDLGQQRYQFEKFRLSGEASGEPLAGKTVAFSAQGELLADLDAQIAEWTSLKFSANQLRGLGDIKVRELDREPRISGGLSIAAFNLRDFLAGLGREVPVTSDANALTRVELATRLNGTPNSLALEELTLKLDDTIITGRVAVEDLARMALRLQLKGDRLDVSRYLPPKQTDSASAARQAEIQDAESASPGDTALPAAPTRNAWSDAPVLPIDTLRLLDAQATIGFDELLFDAHPFTQLNLNVQSRDGLLMLQGLRGNVYESNFEASGKVDVRQALPILSMSGQLNKLPVEKFIKLEKQESPVQGLLDLNAAFTTRGNSQKSWIDNLNGNANFVFSDGLLVGADLEHYLCRAVATLNRKSLTRTPSKDTPFETLRGSLQIVNGVAHNPDFKASIPGLTINGSGTIDLRVLGLDYLIGILIEGDKRAMPDPACQVNERYVGLEWPLRCRGPLELAAKSCRIDQEGLGKITAKLAGEKLTEKLDEKLGDKVSPELKDALKGLFKR